MPRRQNNNGALVCTLIILLMLMFIPVLKGHSAAFFIRGVVGDVSILTLCLLLAGTFSRLGLVKPLEEKQNLLVLVSVIVIGIPFYTATLGMTYVDPYRWGFGSMLLLPLFVVALWASWVRYWFIASVVTLIVIVWAVGGGLESGNLWDYLIDPLLLVYALWFFLLRGVVSFWGVVSLVRLTDFLTIARARANTHAYVFAGGMAVAVFFAFVMNLPV